MKNCPTCNRPLVCIDTDQLEALAALNMPRKERVLLERLVQRFPRIITNEDLICAIWEDFGEKEPDDVMACVQQFACRVRRKIKPLGWGLRNERYLGYKLVRL